VDLIKRLEILQSVDVTEGRGTLGIFAHDKCHYFTKIACIEKKIDQVVLFCIKHHSGTGYEVIHSACWLGDSALDVGGVRSISDIATYYKMAGMWWGQESEIFTGILDLGRFDPDEYYSEVLDNSKELEVSVINWLRALDDHDLLKGLG